MENIEEIKSGIQIAVIPVDGEGNLLFIKEFIQDKEK